MANAGLAAKLEALKRLGTATVHEGLGQRGYVDSAIAQLEAVREAPVAEHGGMYAGLHDALLAALDAEER